MYGLSNDLNCINTYDVCGHTFKVFLATDVDLFHELSLLLEIRSKVGNSKCMAERLCWIGFIKTEMGKNCLLGGFI